MTLWSYVWGNNAKRATMRGRWCRIIARGNMNSILIEFLDNGQQEITSRYAVRAVKDGEPVQRALALRKGGG